MSRMIFIITGKPGSGKTALWKKIWESEMENIAGYITVPYERDGAFAGYEMVDLMSGERRAISQRVKEAADGNGSTVLCELPQDVFVKGNGHFIAVEETFSGFGTELLHRAAASEREVIVLDELGRFEQHCEAFIGAVWDVIHSGKKVCLVLKKEPIPFLEKMKEKVDGILIDLDETGRERGEQMLRTAVLQSRLSFHIQTRLFLKEKSFGPGPMRLLEDIRESGSLSHAAKQMGMSYSKAWTILKGIESEWGIPLLKKQAGGNHGGSSELTREGEELLRRYEAFCREIDQAAETAFEKYFDRPIFS